MLSDDRKRGTVKLCRKKIQCSIKISFKEPALKCFGAETPVRKSEISSGFFIFFVFLLDKALNIVYNTRENKFHNKGVKPYAREN